MSKTYTISFTTVDLDQLLKVLYSQTTIPDENAIRLISQINKEVQKSSPLTTGKKNLLANDQLDLTLAGATETYRRYRVDHSLAESMPSLPQSPETIAFYQPDPNQHQPDRNFEKPDSIHAVVQALETIAHCLAQQNRPLSQPLGFTATYRKEVIYCEAQHGTSWHLLNEWGQPIPLTARALTCLVQSLEVQQNVPVPKINLHVQADKLYCLESPCYSLFSKTLLLSLASLPAQHLKQRITLEPVQSKNSSELFCRVYYQGTPVTNAYGKNPPWPAVLKRVLENLEQANGQLRPLGMGNPYTLG